MMFAKREKIITVFDFHCSFTPKLLIVLGVITTLNQYVGNPLRCTVDGLPLPEINADCAVAGTTFTAKNPIQTTQVTFPTHYHWMSWYLLLQAFLCYLPKWLWETWENGWMERLLGGMKHGVRSEEELGKHKQFLTKYLTTHFNHHNRYALVFWVCQGQCFANAVFQTLVIHSFLNGHFADVSLEGDDKINSLPFPDVVNCTVGRFDEFGKIVRYEAVCSLPWITLNEKIYICLRIWFFIMAVLTLVAAMTITLTIIVLLVPTARTACLRRFFPNIALHLIECLSRRISFGDFWFLNHLGQNIYRSMLSDILKDVAEIFYRDG